MKSKSEKLSLSHQANVLQQTKIYLKTGQIN